MSGQPEARLPKWVEERYDKLWNSFRANSFNLDQAFELLKKSHKDKRENIPVILSEIKKAGWLTAELDPKDSRKRTYNLISQKDIIDKVLDIEKETIGREEIERILKRAADLIRTRVDYKFILVLLFLKRVNDKWELEYDHAYQEAIEDGLSEKDAKKEAASSAYHDFDLPKESQWENLRKEVEVLPEIFSKAMKTLSERNPDLRDIFDNVDFLQFASNRENAEILKQLVELFSERRLHTVSADILGDAYEWILRYFSPEKAKEGEVYTPREVIKLLVELTDPKPNEKVYDPACASGGMLIISYQHVKENKGKKSADKLFLFGQEANPHTLALGRMNLYIHDITNAQLAPGDTLLRPKFKENDDVKKFNVVLANPPWNQDGYDEDVLKKGEFWHKRFGYGFTPAQSADWSWIQHMLASSDKNNGRVGIVVDTGCLFRTGKETPIRSQIVKNDKIDSVILLPEKLFYNTSAPAALIILSHNKPPERKKKILFINASGQSERHPEVRKLFKITNDHIEKITKAYRDYENIKGFAKKVNIEEVENNDFNLTVGWYVDTFEKEAYVDLFPVLDETKELESDSEKLEQRLSPYFEKILKQLEVKNDNHKLPSDWKMVKLDDYVDIKGRIGWRGLKKSEYTKKGPYLIANRHIKKQKISWEDCDHISDFRYDESPEISLQLNDVIMSKDGTIGQVAFIDKLPGKATLNSTMMVIRVTNKDLYPKFLYYFLQGPIFKKFINQKISGSSIPHIFQRDMKNFTIPLPPPEEQEEIINALTILDDRLELEDKRKKNLDQIKQTLMNNLVLGKARL